MPKRRFDEPDFEGEGGRAARRLADFEFLRGNGPEQDAGTESETSEPTGDLSTPVERVRDGDAESPECEDDAGSETETQHGR